MKYCTKLLLQGLNKWSVGLLMIAGHQAMQYFSALPVAGEGLVLEPLKEGNNEAEWIVDLTTQADRQGRWGNAALENAPYFHHIT